MLFATTGNEHEVRFLCDETDNKSSKSVSNIRLQGSKVYRSVEGLISFLDPEKVTLSGIQAAIDASGACPGLRVKENIVSDFQAIAPALVGPLVAGNIGKEPNGSPVVGYTFRGVDSTSTLLWRGGPLGAQAVWLRDRIMVEFAQFSLGNNVAQISDAAKKQEALVAAWEEKLAAAGQMQKEKWNMALWIFIVCVVALSAAIFYVSRKRS